MNVQPQVAALLQHRQWMRFTDPFPHIYAADVFRPDVHFAIEKGMNEVLARGLSETPATGRLSRSMPGYDAYGCGGFGNDMPAALQFFFSRPWHDLLAGACGVLSTGHIQGGLHHHRVGSASGQVHNDFVPGWFADQPRDDGLIPGRAELCDYKTGRRLADGVQTRRVVRAASMIYFAGNGTWSAGDGGSTGLYRRGADPIDAPAVEIPPVNNSLLLFEITPFSFHTFISNVGRERNSVILFLHADLDAAVARWGENRIGRWESL